MFVDIGYIDMYVKVHVAELQREIEHDDLVRLATGPGRPVRLRIAEWLHAAAEWIEGSPRRSVVGAEA